MQSQSVCITAIISFIVLSLNTQLLMAQTVYSEADKEKILNKANYPLYKSDLAKAKVLWDDYRDYISQGVYDWQMVVYLEANRDTLERMAKTYSELWKLYLEESGKKDELQYLYENALGCINGTEQ